MRQVDGLQCLHTGECFDANVGEAGSQRQVECGERGGLGQRDNSGVIQGVSLEVKRVQTTMERDGPTRGDGEGRTSGKAELDERIAAAHGVDKGVRDGPIGDLKGLQAG